MKSCVLRFRRIALFSQFHAMHCIVRFGVDSSVEFNLPDGVLLAECGTPRARPVDDPAGAVAQALAEPLGYPPLAKCTTPGDRVALVLDRDLPQAPQIAAGVVRSLVAGGVEPDGITVLQTPGDVEVGSRELCRGLPADWQQRIAVITHDPADRGRMAYLAASESGEPIFLNRAITDADLVLPIGCASRPKEAGRFGIHSPIYPTFSDQRTLERFRAPDALHSQGPQRKRLVRQVDEVGWLLGVTFTVQAVPGPGGRILHLLAGEVGAVGRRSQELYHRAWSCTAPGQASLVLAAIEGDAAQQTWRHVGHSLEAAAALVEEGGAIALCCDLADAPGPAVQRLAGAPSREAALRQIRKERSEDALQAAQLAAAQERARLYLLSGLDPALLEELEIAAIADTRELGRLAARHKSCIVLANACLALARLEVPS